MNQGLSDQVRAMAQARYVKPAIRSGKKEFSISVRDLLNDLTPGGFPKRHTPQICSALRTSKFLKENGLEIEEVIGPPKKVSPTVVVRYRVVESSIQPAIVERPLERQQIEPDDEDPETWALRVTEKIRGLLKEEIAQIGGAEAFMRWVRSEDEDAE
jgi:hypothetical protein